MSNQNFRWENIAVNTWAAKIPVGWIIKSVDTKNRLDTTVSHAVYRKEPIAMSSSMIVINDPAHNWTPTQFKWVNIARDTWRAQVEGGWIIKCVDAKNIHYPNMEQISISSSMQFISDPEYLWEVTKSYKKKIVEADDRGDQIFSNQDDEVEEYAD
jgi:hypothetical protein